MVDTGTSLMLILSFDSRKKYRQQNIASKISPAKYRQQNIVNIHYFTILLVL
jgi:hypothetical protein